MSMGEYLKSMAGELLLVWVSAWAMSMVGFNAFYLDGVSGAVQGVIAGISVGILVLLLCVSSYKRSRWLFGAVAFVVIVAFGLAVASALSVADAAAYEDAEGNYLYLVLVIAFASAGCYLLTRTLPGSVVWFVVACFFCSVVQAFYLSEEVVMSAIVLVSSLSLVIVKNFAAGRSSSDLAASGGASKLAAFASSVVPVLAAGALALTAWFAIIAPLDPGVFKVYLITDYRSLPIVQLKGTANTAPIVNTDLKSPNLNDGARFTTDDLKEGESDVKIDATSMPDAQSRSSQGQLGGGRSSGSHTTIDQENPDPEFSPISYSIIFPVIVAAIIVVLLIIAAIVAYFLIRRRRRADRLALILAKEPKACVEELYLFLLKRLGMLGYTVPNGATLSGFAKGRQRSMDAITLETGVPFTVLTETYVKCVYGGYKPTEDEVVPFVAYYQGFWKAARSKLGNVKYFFKSFRLG